ncbi:hypothetical protein [Dyella acidiphila]|uniref:Uncharacterized protein n=1 Tax=Dyella acidiphila TaxID=2775866 RepID=A0ABR9GEB0_9GAMM|nr:hypothetical protein [Dyella acidiphila]MBE1162393.1 hypothetical protein [Dyella acidiphila]
MVNSRHFPQSNNRIKEIKMTWNPTSKYTRFHLFDEVSDCFKWIQDRSVALGVLGLALANLFWFDFSIQYHIPVNLFSTSTLSALPALLVFIAFFIVVFAGALLMPTVILVSPINKEGIALIDLRGEIVASPLGSGSKFNAWKRWLIATVILPGVWMTIVAAVTFLHEEVNGFIVIFALMLTILVGLRILTGRLNIQWTADIAVNSFFGLFLQSIITLEMILVSLHFVKGNQWIAYGGPASGFLCALILLVVGQSAVAHIVRTKGMYRGIFTHLIIVAGCVFFVLAIAIPLGGEIASLPIRLASSGARNCLVLKLSDKASTAKTSVPDAALIDDQNKSETKPLSLALPIDGNYYIKLRDDVSDAVYKLAQDDVSKFQTCPSK